MTRATVVAALVMANLMAAWMAPAAAMGLAQSADGEVRTLPKGRIVPMVATLAEPGQQYALFLPDDYTSERRWPVMVLLDARGRGEAIARLAETGARTHGWVVLSSHQSQSDGDEAVTLRALQALLREVGQRYAYDPRRLYVGGFSGTAKTLWTQAGPLREVVAGWFGNGGGRPPELGALRQPPHAFFGTAGTADFNFQEMRDLDALLADLQATHRLDTFDGPHGWPPASLFAQAFAWFDLVAMRDGRLPKRPDWIQAQFGQRLHQARGHADALDRWRGLDQIQRDFDGLLEVDAVAAEARGLRQDPRTQAALRQEARLRAEERASAQRLDAWIARIDARDPASGRAMDPPDRGSALRELRIASLKTLAEDSDPRVSASGQRRLERIGVATGFYLPRRYFALGDEARAAAMLEIAIAVFPERPQPHFLLAKARAGMGRVDQAFAALAEARRLGLVDAASLASDPAWERLRDDPRWAQASAPLP